MAESELESWESALSAFVSSDAPFQLVHRLRVAKRPAEAERCHAAEPPTSPDVHAITVLDSSFNPPTAAHAALARASLRRLALSASGRPIGLLILLAIVNADKPPAPAPLAHRLAMMVRFARQLRQDFLDAAGPSAPAVIDVGLTTAAYYADKRAAVAADPSGAYGGAAGAAPEQAYVLGFDTLERVLAPRYYPRHDPPLSALADFFASGARLHVVLRPGGGGDGEEQRRVVRGLGRGALAAEGFRAEWAAQVEILTVGGEGGADSLGDLASVSSTRARAAARDGATEDLARLVCPSVADWILKHNLYMAV